MISGPRGFTLFPYTTLFRSRPLGRGQLLAAIELGLRPFAEAGIVRKVERVMDMDIRAVAAAGAERPDRAATALMSISMTRSDRKSTRLNSSHLGISYAVFCLNDLRSSWLHSLSLHDALPISSARPGSVARCHRTWAAAVRRGRHRPQGRTGHGYGHKGRCCGGRRAARPGGNGPYVHIHDPFRSEEHTSELQSLRHLVCRLLLE